jgi:hypothetical protein
MLRLYFVHSRVKIDDFTVYDLLPGNGEISGDLLF